VRPSIFYFILFFW